MMGDKGETKKITLKVYLLLQLLFFSSMIIPMMIIVFEHAGIYVNNGFILLIFILLLIIYSFGLLYLKLNIKIIQNFIKKRIENFHSGFVFIYFMVL